MVALRQLRQPLLLLLRRCSSSSCPSDLLRRPSTQLSSPLLPFPLQRSAGYFRSYAHRCFSSTAVEYERDQLHDDTKKLEKEVALNEALTQLAVGGYFDRESRLSLPRFFVSRYMPVISTGSLKLDLALGIGGLPKGRIVEIYGKEASGKTTLALHIIKEAQKHGGCCAYFDVENAIDPSLLDAMGVNTEKLLFARPDCAENTLSVVNTLANSGAIDVIVVDSVAALVPKCELENTLGASDEDLQSRLMTRALRRIYSSLSQSRTLVIFVNQVRANVSSGRDHGYISEVTCGGNALQFYAAVRLRTARACLLQTGEKISGIGISVEVMKNKLAPAMKKAELKIGFGRGICCEAEVLELASDHNIISKEGNGYRIQGTLLESQLEAEEYLAKNGGVMDMLTVCLRSILF